MIARELRQDGHDVVEFGDGATLLAQLRFDVVTRHLEEDRCLVIAGQRTSVFTGLEVLSRLRRNAWDTPCVIVNAGDDPRLHAAARRLGAAAVLAAFDVERLRAMARRIVARPSAG
jgi:two-component system, response regulator, stage 0 sporulation protein F